MERPWGVGIVITDPNRSLFLVERKCDRYPYKQYRGAYSFIGGGCEAGETVEGTLFRELGEEMTPKMADEVSKVARHLFDVSITKGDTYDYSLFESVLPVRMFDGIEAHKIEEGKGVVVARDKLVEVPFIWGLEDVVDLYLRGHGSLR
ncbi:MAG: NUDIX hydrolase [Nanoarchaeota archaeon]